MKLFATIITVKVHWGYSIRTFPASASQRSFSIPPSTTIVGALAYAYASVNNINREYSTIEYPFTNYVSEFIEEFGINYATVHLPEPIYEHSFQTIRYFTMPVQAPKTDVERFSETLKIAEMFNPIQIGYMICSTLTSTLIILSEKPIPKAIMWSILRLGSKESIVSVQDAYQEEVQPIEVSEGDIIHIVNTSYISDLAEPQPPANYIIERMPAPITRDEWLRWYSFKLHPTVLERNVIIPLPEVFTSVRILKPSYKFTITSRNKQLITIIPKEALKK
ncbi:MAG: hypothetical protein QXK24_02340 [Ignisphaera sp.]|uniref:Type I-A CRISPR-associated protein Cas5 n=1 Tax=Ignisphaera aggregans TaxID=334771 RepID=A0A7C4JJQ3_9CREN